VRGIRRSGCWCSPSLSANVGRIVVLKPTEGIDAISGSEVFPHVCGPMLLTFLLGGEGGPHPHAHGFAVAYPLFNGRLRLRAVSLRDAGPPAVVSAAAGERILIFRAIVSNGSSDRVMGNFDAALADDDGNIVVGRPLEGDWNLARGGAARTAAEFHVDPNFMPVELILIDTSEPDVTAFRFDVRATPRATGLPLGVFV
jgi:hypothetical protein